MPHEAIVDIVAGLAEVGADAAISSNSNSQKTGMGCLFLTTVLLLLGIGVYFLCYNDSPTRGIITKKLPENKMVVKTKDGEDVYTITPSLYINKEEGDSITLN